MLIKGFVGKNIDSVTRLVNDFLVGVGVIDVEVENHPYEYRFFIKYDKPNGKNVKIRYFAGEEFLTLVREIERFSEKVNVIDVKMVSYDRNDYEYWEDDCHTTEFLVIYEDNANELVKRPERIRGAEVFSGSNLAVLEKEIRFFMSKSKVSGISMKCSHGVYTVMAEYDTEKGRRLDIKAFGGEIKDIEPKINKFLPAVSAVDLITVGYKNYQSCIILYSEPDGRKIQAKYFTGSDTEKVKKELAQFVNSVDTVSIKLTSTADGPAFLVTYETD